MTKLPLCARGFTCAIINSRISVLKLAGLAYLPDEETETCSDGQRFKVQVKLSLWGG